jgi:hypothetical protein
MLGLVCFVGGSFLSAYSTYNGIENVCHGLDRFIGKKVKIPSVETFVMNGTFMDMTLVNKDERRTWAEFEQLMYTYATDFLAHAGMQKSVSRETIAHAVKTGDTQLVYSVNCMFTCAAKYVLGDLNLQDENDAYMNTWFKEKMTMAHRRVIHEAVQLLFVAQERNGVKTR